MEASGNQRMNDSHRRYLEKLRDTHRKRLRVLELQAAAFGNLAPPHVLVEIEDIREKIGTIEAELATSQETVLQLTRQQKLTILFLAADPSDGTRLRLGEELREIQAKLHLATMREQFDLHQRMSVRPADISQSLLDVKPQIVHFSGHGTETGALCFEDENRLTRLIEPDALAELFEQFADQVSCVILNACHSETQAEAIARHIDYVIGMNQSISDRAGIAFAVGFYQALGAGRKIESAYRMGCVLIKLHGIPESLTPVLIAQRQSHA